MTMMFTFAVGRPDSQTMRTAAQNVGVEWDEHAVQYSGGAIGYANAPSDADPTPLQDELETMVGVRPSVVTG